MKRIFLHNQWHFFYKNSIIQVYRTLQILHFDTQEKKEKKAAMTRISLRSGTSIYSVYYANAYASTLISRSEYNRLLHAALDIPCGFPSIFLTPSFFKNCLFLIVSLLTAEVSSRVHACERTCDCLKEKKRNFMSQDLYMGTYRSVCKS